MPKRMIERREKEREKGRRRDIDTQNYLAKLSASIHIVKKWLEPISFKSKV